MLLRTLSLNSFFGCVQNGLGVNCLRLTHGHPLADCALFTSFFWFVQSLTNDHRDINCCQAPILPGMEFRPHTLQACLDLFYKAISISPLYLLHPSAHTHTRTHTHTHTHTSSPCPQNFGSVMCLVLHINGLASFSPCPQNFERFGNTAARGAG